MDNLNSMTGFATVQTKYDDTEITCEIRSVNSRYLEISVKLPRVLADLENQLKDIIRKKVTRGKIMYSLNFSALTSELQNLKIDPGTVKTYMNLLEQMREAAGVDSPINLDHLLFFKDIISFEEDSHLNEELVEIIEKITEETLDKLNEMRTREGSNLKDDLAARLDKIERITGEVSVLGKDSPRVEFEKLYNRLLSMLSEDKIDRARLEQELAIISDKVDITEETVRMKSHIQLFRENLEAGSPIGKKLNFILQEMHREANTMSSKTTIVDISHRVVEIKEDVEKLREQIQNIE
ncbi:MAG: YicC family protein [Calditrichia bacterium]